MKKEQNTIINLISHIDNTIKGLEKRKRELVNILKDTQKRGNKK